MKKSSIITILLIFILPVALYFFLKTPSEDTFTQANAARNLPSVLQFSSTMCYDCKRLEKNMSSLRTQYSGKINFQKINISNRTARINQLIERYNINVVPTLIFLDKNGNFVRKLEGFVSKSQLKNYLEDLAKR